jgi:hypothetical protein
VSVRDLYISRIGPHIFLEQNRQTDLGNIYISHRYMSVGTLGTGRQNITMLFWKSQFHFWEFLNRNQPFILNSHRPSFAVYPNDSFIGLGSIPVPLAAHIGNRIPSHNKRKRTEKMKVISILAVSVIALGREGALEPFQLI